MVDAVGADTVVGVDAGCWVGWCRWWPGWRDVAASGAAGGGVLVDEVVDLGLEFGDGGGAGLAGEPFLEGLVEAFNFSAGGGVAGVELICVMPWRCSSASKPLHPPLPPANRVVETMPLSVNVEYGMPC